MHGYRDRHSCTYEFGCGTWQSSEKSRGCKFKVVNGSVHLLLRADCLATEQETVFIPPTLQDTHKNSRSGSFKVHHKMQCLRSPAVLHPEKECGGSNCSVHEQNVCSHLGFGVIPFAIRRSVSDALQSTDVRTDTARAAATQSSAK